MSVSIFATCCLLLESMSHTVVAEDELDASR